MNDKLLEKLLHDNGWEVECWSPFEIRHKEGSFASGMGARAVVDSLKEELSSSLTLTAAPVRYTHSVNIFDLPESVQTAVRNVGMKNDYLMLDYMDGDYKLPIDFTLLDRDTTDDETIALFLTHFDGDDEKLADQYSDTNYPYKDWNELGVFFLDYLNWVIALRFIAQRVPPHMLKPSTLAINVWH